MEWQENFFDDSGYAAGGGPIYGDGPLPDYTYKPSLYKTLDLDDYEYAQMDEWARKMNEQIPDEDTYSFAKDLIRIDRPQEIGSVMQHEVQVESGTLWDQLAVPIDGYNDVDRTVLYQHEKARSGFMLSVVVMICDEFWEKGMYCYMKVNLGTSSRTRPQDVEKIEYDSEDEPLAEQESSMIYRVVERQMVAFMYVYSSGVRAGISERVRELLLKELIVPFDFRPWVNMNRDDCVKLGHVPSGQVKIFLSSLRAFDKLSAGRITILVIGSASHPVKSGYTYTALAKFLSLSGFNGVMDLYDPTEQHVSCKIDNFQMNYHQQEFKYGSRYLMEGKDPTVILDDVFAHEGKISAQLDEAYALILNHPNSRITMKYYESQKPCPKVQSRVSRQYAYEGRELRIYYRVPTTNVSVGQYIGNGQCAQCWYYSGLISRVGSPIENVRPYWHLLYGLSGHNCTPVPGIRNVCLLNMMKHQISRGFDNVETIATVFENMPKGFKADIKKLNQVMEFGQKIDPALVQVQQTYPPNFDMNFNIRESVAERHIVLMLDELPVNCALVLTPSYPKAKFDLVSQMYRATVDESKPVVKVYLGRDWLGVGDCWLAVVEKGSGSPPRNYQEYRKDGGVEIWINHIASRSHRLLFDRGRHNVICDDL